METDNKNVIYWSMGFTVLNLNTLVKTVKYDYIRNNHYNGGYTIEMWNKNSDTKINKHNYADVKKLIKTIILNIK